MLNRALVKTNRNIVSAIAQFNNTDLVGHIQRHLIIINGKHECIHISTVTEGIECDT